MSQFLYDMVMLISRIHTDIMTLNDASGQFTDKDLHFLVMGLVGMSIFIVSYILFKLLQKHVMVIAFIYAVTLMFVLTFAIEIGQGVTGTGMMEAEDIYAGMSGFFIMFVVFAVLRWIVLSVYKAVKGRGGDGRHAQRGEL